jgi:hypothetical protein
MGGFRWSGDAARRGAFACAVLSLASCSWAYDWGLAQCTSSVDCADLGPGFEGAACVAGRCEAPDDAAGAGGAAGGAATLPSSWSCTAEPGSGRPAIEGNVIAVKGTVKRFDASPLAGASVKACSQLDFACAGPAAGPVASNEAGRYELQLPATFQGYLEITANGCLPTLVMPVSPNAFGELRDVSPLQFELAEQLNGYVNAGLGRSATVEEYGAVYVRAIDCMWVHAPGVRFALERPGESALVYYENQFINFGLEKTSADGSATFMYAPSGVNSVVATLAESGIELDRAGIIVRPGTVTTVALGPGRTLAVP